MSARAAVIAIFVALAAACSKFAAYEGLAGSYELTAVDGKPIPANVGPLPARDASPQRCSIEYYWGRLVLTEERAFEIRYNSRNTCTGADLSQSEGKGRYRVHGSEIQFTFPQAGVAVAGEVHGHDIVWKDVHELLFQRTD